MFRISNIFRAFRFKTISRNAPLSGGGRSRMKIFNVAWFHEGKSREKREILVKIWWKLDENLDRSRLYRPLFEFCLRFRQEFGVILYFEKEKNQNLLKKKRNFFRRKSWFFRILRPNFCEILNFFFEFV